MEAKTATGHYINTFFEDGTDVFVILNEANCSPTPHEVSMIEDTIRGTKERTGLWNDCLEKAIDDLKLKCLTFDYQLLVSFRNEEFPMNYKNTEIKKASKDCPEFAECEHDLIKLFLKNAEEKAEVPEPGDPVNHPSHYTDGKIEVIDFIEDKKLPFHLGNAVKYISRAGKKDPSKTVEDLEKAVWYLNRYIDLLEKEEKK